MTSPTKNSHLEKEDEVEPKAAKERIIVALDVDSLEKVERLVSELGAYVGCFKIGLELINAVGGPQAVDFILKLGGQVFYDIKLKDIPNTMAGASKSITRLGVKMFNLHADNTIEAMKAAVENRGLALLLGVTVLTSIDEENCQLIYGASTKAKVLCFARNAMLAGLDGIVCSPQELKVIASHPELAEFLKVTPGVRPDWAQAGDQKRVMTPGEAIKAGADFLVIGRPITNPPKTFHSPLEAVQRIAEEIASALPQ